MQITPNIPTIGNLFNSPNEQFFIPAYQRRYAWTEKECEALFNDVLFLRKNDSHLFGTILFITDYFTAGINKLEIVDGQQRITTLCLLFKAILKKLEELESDKVSEINKYLSCLGLNGEKQLKLKLGDLDDPDFRIIMEDGNMDGIRNKKLLNSYNYFLKRVNELEKGNDLEDYYNKLVNYSKIFRLDIGAARDAYKLFETINNRGLELSTTDVIKNFLLGHASSLDEEKLEEIRSNWKSLVVNLDGINMDKFFRHLMMGRAKVKITENKLIDEFIDYYYVNIEEAKTLSDYHFRIKKKKSIKDLNKEEKEHFDEEYYTEESKKFYENKKMSIVEFSKFLKDSSKIYANLINRNFNKEEINRHLNDLQRIKSTPAYTFLLNLLQRNIESSTEIEKTLSLIKVFMLRRHICEYRTSELDDIFARLVKVNSLNISRNVQNHLSKHLPGDREFEEKFATTRYKTSLKDRAKYVLEQIEYYKINHQREFFLQSGDDVHLEHIIPLSINTRKSREEFGDWVSYLGDDAPELHKEYVWRIGNLTLLARRLNIIASNNPFLAKVNEYKESNIALNKQIINNFKEFKFGQVEQRSKEFARLAVEIWRF
jgi:uncharacterized protein with ParB-like and HNH nuclease domain